MSIENQSPDPLAQLAEWRAALRHNWELQPEKVVYGQMSSAPFSALRSRGDLQWWLGFGLCRWQYPDSLIEERPLWVTWPAAYVRFDERLRPGAVLALRAKVCHESPLGEARALWLQWLSAPADGLRAPAPEPAPDPQEWRVDERLRGVRRTGERLVGEVVWLGLPLIIYLALDHNGSAAPAIAAAGRLLDEAASWNERLLLAAAERLLPLKNSQWLDEGETPVTAESFAQRLVAESITVAADGSAVFRYLDGDLFFGHRVEMAVRSGGEISTVKLRS